jgi:hypothetical protein
MTSIERVVAKRRLEDPDEPWRFWVTRPVTERLEAVEQLRCEHHGWSHGAEPRLPRVLAIVRSDMTFAS